MIIKQKRELVDTQTGEVLEAFIITKEPRDKGFVKVFKAFGEDVLEDLGSLNGEAKLLLWFLAKTLRQPLGSDMWIPVSYRNLAQELNTNERTIKRWIKTLTEKNYIQQFEKRHTTFRFNPLYVYKGVLSSENGIKALRSAGIERKATKREERAGVRNA